METLIRNRFRQSGLSIKALAERSGMTYSPIHRFITGAGTLTLPSVDKVCTVLGLELRPVKRRKGS